MKVTKMKTKCPLQSVFNSNHLPYLNKSQVIAPEN